MKIIRFVALLVAFPAVVAAQYEPLLTTSPPLPNEFQKTRLHLQTWCLVADPANATFDRQGYRLKVLMDGTGCILSYPPPQDTPFDVDAGVLPLGSYSVELWIRGDSGSEPQLAASFELEVLGVPPPTDPQLPLDSVPTWLVVFQNSLLTDAAPLAHRDGQTIQISTTGTPCPILCPPLVVPIELGLLEAGTYSVQFLAEGVPYWSFPLVVGSGPRLSLAPATPSAGGAASLHISGASGSCPSAGAPTLDDHSLTVAIDAGDCAGPPQWVDLVVPLPALEAGSYTAAVLSNGQPAGSTSFEVLPGVPTLRDGRFELSVSWQNADGEQGPGHLVQAPSADSALFYFFSPNNWELMVKVLDGCAINDSYWVFAAASTDVAYTVEIRDLAHPGASYRFANALGERAAAITHLDAFSCP